MENLNTISESIRAAFVTKNAARDEAVNRSRELVRHCSEAIRAIHRREWDKAADKMTTAKAAAGDLTKGLNNYPDLYHAGYTQDALKEVVEAFCTYAIVRGLPLPTPQELNVENDTF